MKRRAFFFVAVVAAVVGAGFVHAVATTVDPINLDDAHKVVKKSYAGLPSGAYDQVLVPDPDNCDANPGAALIPVRTKFKRIEGSLFKFVVSWSEADTYINIYFFDEDGNVIAQAYDAPPGRSKRPKEVNLGNLENGAYSLCVYNSGGVNTGFTVDATVKFASRYQPPRESEPTPQPPPSAPPTAAPVSTPAPTQEATPVPAGEPVATPGPDGPDRKQGLLAVAGSKQASVRNERSIAQIVFLALTVAIGVAGIVLVALRIRRDTT